MDFGKANDKAAWRKRFLEARASLTLEERAEAAAAITNKILALPEITSAKTVHVFWPMLDRGEIDTRPLIGRLEAAGKQIVLPVVASRRGEPPVLIHRAYEGEAALVKSAWGLHQPPASAPRVAPGDIDAVVVPALGASREGHRVGHGAGFYDSFLAECSGRRVCVVYAACLVDAVPIEPHDVPLDAIVTEDETVRFP